MKKIFLALALCIGCGSPKERTEFFYKCEKLFVKAREKVISAGCPLNPTDKRCKAIAKQALQAYNDECPEK